ncbi:hypothetical protein EDC04DRAFT_2563036, partial [Pisolithus marmoratus]
QTNAVDVDKHVMTYVEENLKICSRPPNPSESQVERHQRSAQYTLSERWTMENVTHEGSIAAGFSMLTAIPNFDPGVDPEYRLKLNIDKPETAKHQIAEERKAHKRVDNGEVYLVATRFYHLHIQKSDAKIMRNAKLQSTGLLMPEERRPRNDRPEMVTDDIAMERFKKRIRRPLAEHVPVPIHIYYWDPRECLYVAILNM